MKILDFFLFLWIILPSWIRIRNLNADPDRIQQLILMRIRIRNPAGNLAKMKVFLHHYFEVHFSFDLHSVQCFCSFFSV